MVNDPDPGTAANPAAGESAPAQLKKRVISGSAWVIAGYGGSQLLRLGGNLVFAKLLFPEAFGLMALVTVFVQGLTLFSDIGIGPSIIQSRRGEELVFLNTAWTIQVVRGLILWLVSVAGAGPFAAWYEQPQLASLIPVAALGSIISGFTSTRIFTASRKISLARITLLEFVGQTAGLVSMLVWCWFSRDVWAIVYGGLIGAAVKTLLSHVALVGERNRLTFDREAARELMHFGRWVFISTALSFLAAQVDRLMLGKFVPLDKLGVYSIAMNLAWLTPMIGGNLAAGVLFPLLAHHSRTDARAYERAIYSARSLLLDGTLFMLAGLALLAPAFFHLLYDRRYEEAAWMAQLLTLPIWVSMLMISADRAVLAVGESSTLAVSNAAALVGKLAACSLGFYLGGLPGFIMGLAVGFLAGHIPIVLSLRRKGVHLLKQDLPYSAIALAMVGGGVLAQRWAMTHVDLRWLKWVELGVALLVLVPLGWQTLKRTKQVMARK